MSEYTNQSESEKTVAQLISWLTKGFLEEGFSVPARKKQRKIIKAAEKELGQRTHSLQAALLGAFQEVHPGIRPGRIMQVCSGARYKLTIPGTQVFVTEVSIPADSLYVRKDNFVVKCLGLNKEGRWAFDQETFEVRVKDLEEIPKDQEIQILRSWIAPDRTYDALVDGDPVELTQDTVKIIKGMFGDASFKLQRGLEGVVDVPDLNRGRDADGLNQQQDARPKQNVDLMWYVGGYTPDEYKLKVKVPIEGHGFMYTIYVPRLRGHIDVPRSLIQKRPFRKNMWTDLKIDSYLRRQIVTCAQGAHSTTLEKWGLRTKIEKGHGAVMLFWGAPGTGKTMAAEALAEHLERPLYVVDSSILGTDLEKFEEGLKETAERSKRWKAVVLWDEAEIYVAKRGNDPDKNQRVAAILRHLEHFDGIMVMTTNRPIELDFVIESRLHLKAVFQTFDPQRREEVWRATIPDEMPIEGFEDVISQLSEIKINGREVKTALLNAAATAAAENLDNVPATYILEEAKALFASSQMLRAAKLHGEDWAEAHDSQITDSNGNNGHVRSIAITTRS